jgi:transposase
VLVEGRSQRSVARELGVSRNTVAKYLTQSEPKRVETTARARWVTEQIAPRLEELLEAWSKRTTRKQRLTGTLLHRQLISEGFEVGETTVRRYFREWKRRRSETYIPLVHRPGDEGQVDFFEVTVEEDGIAHRVWMFVMHLPYSRRSFMRLYDSCDQVAFLDGHVEAFEFLGGFPDRLVYDNLTLAVSRRVGFERVLTSRFKALVSHYLFEPCFARPGEGHDKGSVESRGKGIRLAHMTPVPRGKDLDAISADVQASIETRYWASPSTSERWQDEEKALCSLPETAFDAREPITVRVSRQAMIEVKGSGYSVPSRWKKLLVEVRLGAKDLIIRHGTEEYRCQRLRPGQRRVLYSHYFEELSRKPQAVRQVAPELLDELSPSYRRLWTMLEEHHGSLETARMFAKLLSVVVDHGHEDVAEALEGALSQGRFDLLGLVVDPPIVENEVPEGLRGYCVESAKAQDFDFLLLEAQL